MGLDCHVFRVKKGTNLNSPTLGNWINDEFYYWRKFWPLHEWMERLYKAKGGSETFNLAYVRLDLIDIAALEAVFAKDEELSESERESVLEFAAQAKEALGEGDLLFYTSSW